MQQTKKKKKERGFTMIELIITLAILSFGILGVYGAFTPLAYLSSNIFSRFTAVYLAQEGVEITRNIRDNNFILGTVWPGNLSGCSMGCQADYKTGSGGETIENELKLYDDSYLSLNGSGFYSYDSGGTLTKFKRKITVIGDGINLDRLKVSVVVFWDYQGQAFNFETSGYLYNWH